MMKYLEKFIKYFTDILLVIVIIAVFFAAYSLVQLTVMGKNYVNYFGYTIFEVESASMSPSINIDDIILVKLDAEAKKGDVITYIQGNDFITHRIVEVLDDKLVTKGDFNNSEDKIVSKDMVLGKVVKVVPKLGVWREIVLSPKVIALVFSTLILFSLGCAYTGKKKGTILEQQKELEEKEKQNELRKNLEEKNKKESELRKNLEEENKKLKEELEKENEKKRLREQFESEKKRMQDEYESEKKRLKEELEFEIKKLKEEKEKNNRKEIDEEIELLETEIELLEDFSEDEIL